MEISLLLKEYKPQQSRYKQERHELLEELYVMYEKENKHENWARYLHFLKKNKKLNNEQSRNEFKKAKLPIEQKYIKPFTRTYFAIKLSHIKENSELHFLCSIKRDFEKRNNYKKSAFTKYLMGSIKVK